MGNGSAKLEIEVVMGHAQVRVGLRSAEAGADGSAHREPSTPYGRRAARAPGAERLPGVRRPAGGHPAGLHVLRHRAGRGLRVVRVLLAEHGETDLLRVFLASRGNMREVEKHLGVSYPTARQRFADLLAKLGLGDEPAPRAGA